MGLIAQMKLAMEREGKSEKTFVSYSGYIRRIWHWVKVISPSATSIRDVTDEQWVEIFDRLRRDDRFSPTSISGHMSALKYVHEQVYRVQMRRIKGLTLPRRHENTRVLPHDQEIQEIFSRLKGIPCVVLSLILGTGMRIEETCMLRVHQFDLVGGLIYVKRGKGGKDRPVPIALSLIEPLKRYLAWRKDIWEGDVARGFGRVELPDALGRKYRSADREWEWQWAFPSHQVHKEEGTRWYVSPRTVQRAMKQARKDAGICRNLTPHHLRHAHASALKRRGVDTVDISTILGHSDVETTKLYIHADDVRNMTVPDVFQSVIGDRLARNQPQALRAI